MEKVNFKGTKSTCIALGNFDGVHIGHQSVIKAAVTQAQKTGLLSCVYTFIKHPSVFFGSSKPLLTTTIEKKVLLENLGVSNLFFDDFTNVKDLSPEKFCKEILVDLLGAQEVFCGENYRFGKNAEGDTEILKKYHKSILALFFM